MAEGVGEGAVVGLCAARGAEMVTAVLGVLLSGAAYLPVDPAHPPLRIAAMPEAAGAVLLLAGDGAPPLPPTSTVPVRALSASADPARWRGYRAGPGRQ